MEISLIILSISIGTMLVISGTSNFLLNYHETEDSLFEWLLDDSVTKYNLYFIMGLALLITSLVIMIGGCIQVR